MILCHLIYQLKKYQKEKKPVFLFVASVEKTRQIQKYLQLFFIKSQCATSKDKNIHKLMQYADQLHVKPKVLRYMEVLL